MSNRKHPRASQRVRKPREDSNAKLHPITFCRECGEGIPAKAHTCYHCGTKQRHAEEALQVVFCTKCGEDYPARAMACFHCGHINSRHPYHKGHISI